MGKIGEIVEVWGGYIQGIGDWQKLVEDVVEPKASGCGPIYEFKENPIAGRPDEDFCIADMRNLDVTEPHYHPEGVVEIYFVMQGLGKVFVGAEEQEISPGSVVIMPSLTAHFTVPRRGLVIGVVNTPPFKPEDYIPIYQTDSAVKFNKEAFEQAKLQIEAHGN